ncbi:unnamed protein product [Caenorhabditis angaria]|uniref:Uncharacterized protein n=1 Tax=Caenorhabditis angaria TaxID=860376 RepID=A0A9P1MWU1_9PELO|nr:unnamed protein product [Caenorhabditis angaria]
MKTKPETFRIESICTALTHSIASGAIYYLFHKHALEHIRQFFIDKMQSDLTPVQFARELKHFSDISWLAVISNLCLAIICLMHSRMPCKLMAFLVILIGGVLMVPMDQISS